MSEPGTIKPLRRYTFKSVTGLEATIKTRLGEDSARVAAMRDIWGDRVPSITSAYGHGLDLTAAADVKE